MNTAMALELLKLKLAQTEILEATVTDDALIVELVDGRTISAPHPLVSSIGLCISWRTNPFHPVQGRYSLACFR